MEIARQGPRLGLLQNQRHSYIGVSDVMTSSFGSSINYALGTSATAM